jgi:hypothetical protein
VPTYGGQYELARRERNAKREPQKIVMGGEEFTLLPTIPISASFDLHDAPEPKDGDDMTAEAIRALCGFIRLALIDDDQPRFDALLARREDAIDGADVLSYGRIMAEVYLGFPTDPPTGSSGGRRRNGKPSRSPGRKVTSPT